MQARLVCMCEYYILILVGKGQVNEGFQVELFEIGVLQFNRLVLEQSISVRIPRCNYSRLSDSWIICNEGVSGNCTEKRNMA